MDTPSPSSDPFHGLDPSQLMAAAAMPTDAGAETIRLAPRDLPSQEDIATAFPDLEIQGLIGHGGMSAVFRARQPKLDRTVALKVLPKSLAATPGFAERFNREGRVLARLSHPYIVTVHDFGDSGGFCYLIMEYVDGVNLRQAMKAGRFTPEQALTIVPPLCDALQFAHSQGVLHRDIKPENILLDAKGKVKIADFGIAKILGEDGGDAMLLTQSGARLGTAPYMAPEQVEKPGTVDHRADIYSLGVVFYEMLTGELPLGRFAAPSEKAAVSGGMDEVVFRSLEKERERRQQSASEFKTQVENIAAMPLPMQRALAQRFQSFEYKSRRTLLGMPLLHVTSGIDPTTGRKRVARGFFAFGDVAVGVVACGGYARGLVAFGGLAVGGVAIGGVSLGLLSWGGLALALLFAMGGVSLAPLATGGCAMGWQALGAIALGWHGHGVIVFAQHGMGEQVHAAHVYRAFADMPALLQWLSAISRWTIFGSFLWLPLMLPTILIPWWARRQLELGENDDQAAMRQASTRVLWLILDAVMLCGVMGWMLYAWVTSGRMDAASMIIPAVTGGIGILLSVVSLPLWLRLVPMNSFYGVRLPSTFASHKRWYEVNAVFGKHLFLWSIGIMGAGIAGFYQLPRHYDAYAWAAITLALVGVAASVVATLWWMHQHPVDASAVKKSRLLSWTGQVLVAVVIAMFIKSFIAAPYKINGTESGVIPGSHWMVSRLDTGFSAGNLTVFQHDSGQYWTARVVAQESKGLRLTRGESPEEFFIPWDRIAGKMLFAHFSPDGKAGKPKAVKAPPPRPSNVGRTPKGSPVAEATSKALQQQPRLLFLRMVPNEQPWAQDVHDAKGKPVTLTKLDREILNETTTGCSSPRPQDCWLQAWIQHPDLDAASYVTALPFDAAGKRVETRGVTHSNAETSDVQPPDGAVYSIVLHAGERGHLPSTFELCVEYSLGPWDAPKRVDKDPSKSVATDDLIKGGVGEDSNQHAFVSWMRRRADRQIQCIAHLKDGSKYVGLRSSVTSGKDSMEGARFGLRREEVDYFELRARDIQKVVFKDVVLPPLQKAEVLLEAPGKSGPVPWRKGLTLGDVLEQAYGSAAAANITKAQVIHDGRTENIQISKKTVGRSINPGDKIIIPE